jgi:hypothetical protein
MTDNARRPEGSSGPERGTSAPSSSAEDPFSLEAYLEHQHAEFAGGSTVAELLERADRRRYGGVARELIATTIRDDREERAG